jgi:5'-nucleotidase
MNKKRLLLLLVLLAVVAYIYLRPEQKEPVESTQSTEKLASMARDAEVNILSVNDMHASIDMFPKFAALVDSLRGVYPDLLVFSAGDNRTGNPVNDQYDPVNYPMTALMNKVGFDACTVGNHEWDAGIANLNNDIKRADFPFLCANVIIPSTVDFDIKPFVFIENQGVKLAVIGLIEIRHDGIPGSHPDNLKQLSFRRPETVLPQYKYLKDQNDAVILLSHCGLETDLELAQTNPWLDAILGGHTHTLVENPTEHNGILVTQAGSHLKNATLLTLKFKNGKLVGKKATVLDVNAVRKENVEVAQMVNEFNDAPVLNEAIAVAKTTFKNSEELGCMLTDAIREMSGADFAFQNTGGIRINTLKKGPITVKDVYSIDPFNNEVVVYQMTGTQVKRFILNSFRKNGGYPSYVSGMTYKVSVDGNSVWITMEHGNFSTQQLYKVAMNSYMASTVNIESEDEGQSTFMTSEEMLVAFLRKHKEVDYQGVVRTK